MLVEFVDRRKTYKIQCSKHYLKNPKRYIYTSYNHPLLQLCFGYVFPSSLTVFGLSPRIFSAAGLHLSCYLDLSVQDDPKELMSNSF